MRKTTIALAAVALLGLAPAAVAADDLGPCNDAYEDGSPSGREYAAHHVVPLNKANKGEPHTPGAHRGFSLCIELPDPAQPDPPEAAGGHGPPEATPVARGLADSAAPEHASETGKAHGRGFGRLFVI